MSDRATMSVVLHGESGVGKSWLGDTAPKPLLTLDIEGRAKHTPSGPKITWDPRTESPPEPPSQENPWETCVVSVTDYRVLDTVYGWLRSGQHPFRAVNVDSLMEFQKRVIDTVAGREQMKTQDWGTVLRELESFVRKLRDLLTYDEAHLDLVVIITGSIADGTGRQRPLLQGQLKNTLPYFVDVVGYLFTQPVEGGGYQRALQVAPTPWAVAKDGTDRLGGPTIAAPDLTTLYGQLQNGKDA